MRLASGHSRIYRRIPPHGGMRAQIMRQHPNLKSLPHHSIQYLPPRRQRMDGDDDAPAPILHFYIRFLLMPPFSPSRAPAILRRGSALRFLLKRWRAYDPPTHADPATAGPATPARRRPSPRRSSMRGRSLILPIGEDTPLIPTQFIYHAWGTTCRPTLSPYPAVHLPREKSRPAQ